MGFNIDKAKAALANLEENFKLFAKREEGLDAAIDQRTRLIKAAGEEMARRINALRNQGVQGAAYRDFAGDRDVKHALDSVEEFIAETERDNKGLVGLLLDMQKELGALKDDVDKAAGKEKGKDKDKGKGKGKDPETAADLQPRVDALVADFASTFRFRLKWTIEKMRKDAREILQESFDGAKEIARQDSVDAVKRRLEPRLLTNVRNEATLLFEQIEALGKGGGKGASAGGPGKDSPLGKMVAGEDAAAEGKKLLAELRKRESELAEAVDSVDEKKIAGWKDSPNKDARQAYTDFMEAKEGLAKVRESVAKAETILGKLGK